MTVPPDDDNKSEKSLATTSSRSRTIQSSASFSRPKASALSTQKRSFASAPSSAPLFFSNGGGGSGGTGFFSLGESNIAERARRLKEERSNSKINSNNNSNNNSNKMNSQNSSKNANANANVNKNDTVNAANSGEDGDDVSIVSRASIGESVAKERYEKASLHEFDSLLISNQAGESENLFHQSLIKGFRSLHESRIYNQASDTADAANLVTEEQRRYSATVNFIDPTTKPPTITASPKSAPPALSSNASKPTNLLQQQSMLSHRVGSTNSQNSAATTGSGVSPHIENVYDKLTHIFEKEYGSTIRSVRHKNARTGEINTIRSLPVRPVITMNGSSRGRSSGPSTKQSPRSPSAAPWGGTTSTAMLPVSDPAEWHTGPLCHVYIAACESIDHYRKKVRPSLKAFVSQLESTDSNTAANQQGGHSADYLIVYIPIGDIKANKEPSTPSSNKNNTNTGRLGFFGIGRRSQTSDGQGDNDDISSKCSVDSTDERMDMNNSGPDDSDNETSGAINVLMTFNHLSNLQRTLYKKIATNFPNGKVCVLSTESLEKVFDSEEALGTRVQEWNVFNRLLGQVIVNGFQDRVRRYTSELKRLDAQRASAATAAKNYVSKGSISSKSPKPNPYAFNLSHFFLVKESLAFSYEQMQLPAEALLQYDEFRLYMPDLSDSEERKVRKARRKSKALQHDTPSENLAGLADAGDFLGFRKKIRSEYDLTAILDILRRYLFARELSLLFRMEDPVELLSRCQAFIKVMHSIVLRGINELDKTDQQERKSKAATWVVQFSWDIFCATKQYLSYSSSSSSSSSSGVQQHEPPNISNQKRNSIKSDEAVGAKLSNILEVSRLFLIQLAEDHPESLDAFSMRRKNFPKDLLTPWQPWTPYEPTTTAIDDNETKGDTAISQNGKIQRQFLMTYEDTLASIEKFDQAYLKLCGAIIDTRQVAKHIRQSARIQAEVGEYHASKGDFRKAAASFAKIVKVYRMDHWDHCHFWRVFRLAYCQRTSVVPTAYLKTLCSCFSPRSAVVAPKKALEALFADLQRVIGHPSIGNARYSRLLFIETSLSIAAGSEKSETGRILDHKEVEKRFCTVGENLKLPFSIKSHLPGPIELTSVKLFAVTAGVFKAILTNGDAIQEEDAAKILSIDAPIKVDPGKNDFAFEWSPPRTGQYILSTVEILWKEGYFYYDSMDLQEPLLSIEVEPNEPTHSISMEPAELVPGHDQEVQIIFESGADFMRSVKIVLSGSDGIQIIPPGEDPGSNEWRQDWETELEPFKPGEKKVMKVHVRCGIDPKDSEDESVDPARGLVAKALTTFVYAVTESEEKSDSQSMESTLQAFAPVHGKSALSVESVETHWLAASNDRFLLSVVLTSNAPGRFSVDEWNVKMASPVTITSDMDLNENLLRRSVWEGDQLSFAFECSIDKESSLEPGSCKENNIHLRLCDDEGNKFWIDLPLDLVGFYSRLPDLDSRATPETVQVALTLDRNRGLVGEPLAMTFVVDTDDRKPSNPSNDGISNLVYSIVCPNGHWLLGGKVSGVIPCSGSQTLSCIGVPIVPGVLEHFPTITLKHLDSSGDGASMNVECQQPEVFQSIPLTKANAIATPRYEERQ